MTLAGLVTRRLTLAVALAFAAQIVLVGWEYGIDIEELAKASAEREIAAITKRLTVGKDRLSFEMPPDFEERYERFPRSYGLQIIDGEGEVLLERNAALFVGEPYDPKSRLDLAWKVEPAADHVVRIMARRVEGGPDPYVVRFVAVDDPAGLYWSVLFHETIDHVILPMVPLGLGLILVAAAVVRRSLAPLSAAAEAARRVDPGHTRFRIGTQGLPAEVASLVDAVDRLLERLDDMVAARGAFAGMVAHELRTPLTLLKLDLDRLAGPDAERAQQDVQSMARLVDQLLGMARLEAMPADRMPTIDLAEIARDVVARLAPIAIEAGRELAFSDQGGALALGEGEAISAALRNLVENALRVTPAGGTVLVEAGPGPELLVADEGPGLPADGVATLFERWRQGDTTTRGRAGLGLAIVARTMEIHGGRVTCGNGLEAGAWFRLAFRAE